MTEHESSSMPYDKIKPLMANETGCVNSSRRRITKLGVGAPVILTLASRPVLAGKCLSNMMSGNLSDPDRGHCSKGWSPGGWGNPGGTVAGYSTLSAWSTAGFSYGTYITSCGNPTQASCYENGSKMSSLPGVLNKDGVPSYKKLRKVLNPSDWPEGSNWQLTRHLVCAYLNAALSEVSTGFQYILTKQQVVDLAAGTISLPPGYGSLQAFLDSTWS